MNFKIKKVPVAYILAASSVAVKMDFYAKHRVDNYLAKEMEQENSNDWIR